MGALGEKQVIGTAHFRDNFADCFKEVVNKKRPITIGLRSKNTETATLLSTDLLISLLNNVPCHSSVYWDEGTNQFVAHVQELNGDGVGDTAEEAVEMALDNIEGIIEHFFKNAYVYLNFPKYQELLPLYMRLHLAQDRKETAKILGFIQ